MALYSNRATADFPEFGAIFMSSRTTKEECLERKLFGLPLASADFVQNVRSGMILFLFEYENRKLYGVFEAVSDGNIDILPHAFCSSGKSFPAQVRIRVIWNCRPLPEDDFRDAIRDNYYEAYKFKFGLSKEQVQRLLWLFVFIRTGLQKAPAEKKAKRMHSSFSDSRNIAIDSCDPGHKQGELHEEIKHVDISPTIFLGLEDYIPLDCCDIEVNSDTKPCIKPLYSDTPNRRESVFSRLNLYLQSAASENEDNFGTLDGYSSELTHAALLPKFIQQEEEKNFEADETVNKILENLEQSHHNWIKMRKRCHTESFVSRNTSGSQSTSVFSRLSFTSQCTEQERKVSVFSRLNFESPVHCNDKVNTSLDKSENCRKNVSKKRRQDGYRANHDNGQNISMRIDVNMLEKRYETAEDSPSWGKIEKDTSLMQRNLRQTTLL